MGYTVGSGFPFPNHGCPSCSPTSTVTSFCTGGSSNTISVTFGLYRQSMSTKVCLLGFTRLWPLFLPFTHGSSTETKKPRMELFTSWAQSLAPYSHPPSHLTPQTSTYSWIMWSVMYWLSPLVGGSGAQTPYQTQYRRMRTRQNRKIFIGFGTEPTACYLGETQEISNLLYFSILLSFLSINQQYVKRLYN